MTNTYTCSVKNCNNPACFYLRIAKKLRPVCMQHYSQIKFRRYIKNEKK